MKQLPAFALAALIWFSLFNQAAHDLWAAQVVFGSITLLTLFLLAQSAWRQDSLRLPAWPFVLLVVAAVWSSVPHSYDAFASRQDAWGWTFAFLGFFIAANTLRDIESRNRFMEISCIGLIFIVFETTARGPKGMDYRIVNPLVHAGFLLFWPYWLLERMRERRWVSGLLFTWIALFILIHSFSACVALAVGFIYYHRKALGGWAKTHRMLAGSLVVSALFLIVGLSLYRLRMQTFDYSGMARLHYWASAWAAWRQHLWLGVGVGAFPIASEWFRTPGVLHSQHVHSFPLQMAAEMGAFGLLAFSLFGRQLKLLSTRTPGKTNADDALKAGVLAILVFGVVNINLEYLLNKLLLAIFLGMLVAAKAPTYRIPRLRLAVAGLCLLFFIPFWAGLFVSGQLLVAGQIALSEGKLEEAERLFKDATLTEPANGQAWAARSTAAAYRFAATQAPQDRKDTVTFAEEAFRQLKDPRLQERIESYRR